MDILEGRCTREEGTEALDVIVSKLFLIKWTSTPPKEPRKLKPLSNKQRRRRQYAHIQQLYRLRRKEAARIILEGRWRDAFMDTDKQIEGLEDYWISVFATADSSNSDPEVSEAVER